MRTVFTLRRVALWLLGLAAVVVATDFLTAWYEAGRHSDKLWLHRCNTTAKWLEKRGKFAHFEVDVRFTPEGRFDVTHEAASSIGLGLERYFRLIGPDTTRVWLDIKNLSSANAGAMLAALDSLTRRYAVSRSRLIVESGDWRALALFRRRGYYTSFYVPYAPPSRLSAAERSAAMAHLRRVAASGCVDALSFPGWWYDEIHRHLHTVAIDLLTWEHRKRRLWLLMLPRGRRMLADPQLKVILVKDKGHYHR